MNKNQQKVNLTSSNLSEEKLAELYRILPEAFAENKIDFDKLRTVLGDSIVQGNDKFSFSWAGKSNAIKNVLVPSHLTLNPEPEQSIKWDESENLFIEGDNLEVLKLLQKSYFEKVKMIYIDPPYNTGHDFVYNDDFSAPLDNYLKQTGQKNGDGDSTTTNKETNGRFHSDWLSMMYPRLKLAWNLLRDDGVIFVSIDDNEIHHLRMLMDEVFGEENFLKIISRVTGTPTGGGFEAFVNKVDYILVYRRTINFQVKGISMTAEEEAIYNKQDSKGRYLSRSLRRTGGEDRREDRPSMFYEIEAPDGSKILPLGPTGYESRWICGKNTYQELEKDGFIEWTKGDKGYTPFQKFYLEGRVKQPSNLWDDLEGNKKATREIRDLFDGKKVFDFPKPTQLVQKMIQLSDVKDGELVMDFFCGSGTTAHAVMAQNLEDKSDRKWICIQLPEKTPDGSEALKAGYENIADISKERIQRAAKKLGSHDGFKVFKLSESNYRENNFVLDPEKSPEDNQKEFIAYLQKAKQKKLFSKDDDTSLVYENIVKEGLSLNSKVKKIPIGKNSVYRVVDGNQQLLVCLEDKLASETVKELTDKTNKDRIFICLESSLDDTTAANLSLNLDLKTI